MKFSTLWLEEWAEIGVINAQAISNLTAMTGFEVETIEIMSNEFQDIVVGEIVECILHPKINGLYVIKVNIGKKFLATIITNDKTFKKGKKVVVDISGKRSYRNEEIQTIYSREVYFGGKLCSLIDLNTNDNLYNLPIDLPENAPVGISIREHMKLNDNIIKINISPNRADCLSVIGIAREISAIHHKKLRSLHIIPIKATVNSVIPIQVYEPESCPRYIGRIILDINTKAKTPIWMKEKLRRCGVQPVNVIVDITNYVLVELGQPIHIFDKDKIDGKIIIRMSKKKENIRLEKKHKILLKNNTLVIADNSKLLSLAGIILNNDVKVNNETKNIFVECAFFNPSVIMKSVSDYNLYTESSYRYIHGVDPYLQCNAIEYITNLLIDICGGNPGPALEITSEINLPVKNIIILRRKKLDNFLGYCISDTYVYNVLCYLGFKVSLFKDGWKVISPSWRFDVKIEEDLIEEVARIYGYNNIPNHPMQASLQVNKKHALSTFSLKKIKTLLNAKGYQEVITYSFVNPKIQNKVHPDKKYLKILKPISNEMSVMRLSLWTGLLTTILYNQRRQQNRIRIFEFGWCFNPNKEYDLDIKQDFMFSGAISGARYEEHWDLKKEKVDFYDIKGDLESVLNLIGKLPLIEFRTENIPSALHPGQSASIFLNKVCIGFIGVLHPKLQHDLYIKSRVVMFELQWNKISNYMIPSIQNQNIPHFPINRRDINVVVAENISAVDILSECKKSISYQLIDIKLFDIYRGKNIKNGYKSLSISLFLQDVTHTLKEEEITHIVIKCVESLKKKFQASLREQI